MYRIGLIIFSIFGLTFLEANDSGSKNTQKIWIYFNDKGPVENVRVNEADGLVSDRSLQRRAKVKPVSRLTDHYDLPVYQPYIDEIAPLVERIRTKSRWLNAISVEIDASLIYYIGTLNFVEAVGKVHVSRRHYPEPENFSLHKTYMDTHILDYGPSATQLSQIHVPDMHVKGIYGQDVLIGILDAGYNLLYSHEAFDSLDIVATWDFTENDEDVTGDSHGTWVLSALAGYSPGNLIGPAFKASYLIARTEVASSETPVEEDYWVAGIEWADSMGADVVTSSLGYSEFDDPLFDYTYDDLDGKTATTTIAAEIAAEKGILVFNSAGNEYGSSWHYIITPADGPNVLAIAAVTSEGSRSSFSSAGPTADGRIKPDLAAMGSSVVSASSTNPTGYVNISGTSLSCPLAAGTGALLVSAFPHAHPEQIREALRMTASQANLPDTLLGWGIIDAAAAYNYLNSTLVANEKTEQAPDALELKQNYPNPFNPSTTLRYRFNKPVDVSIEIYNILGKKIATYYPGEQQAGIQQNYQISFAENLSSGVYFYHISGEDSRSGAQYSKSGKMVFLR